MQKFVGIKTQFEGIHCYPESKTFLQHPHRHLFFVVVEIQVEDSNREIEFFELKDFVNKNLPSRELGSKSCEMIAEELLLVLQQKYGEDKRMQVCVSEDNENFSTVVNDD